MSYPPASNKSNGEIDRAGQLLLSEPKTSNDYKLALITVNEWRASFSYPMNTFTTTLRDKTRKYKNVIIAQRLKRLPTILNKLDRFHGMQLSRMQDIGGVRAVLNTIDEVSELEEQYLSKGRLSHILKRHDDYINTPKNDGYRGIHLVYEYNNTLARNGMAPQYNGLLIEMQIRTKLQHSWATAVEAMGTFIGDSFKNGAGSAEWREFFALTSSAFAHAEGCPYCPQHKHLYPAQIYKKIKDIDSKIDALDHIKALSAAANLIHKNLSTSGKKHAYYSLISLDLDNKRVEVQSFNKDNLDKATYMYEQLEQRHGRFDQVLVAVSSLISLKEAYPNYFLDIRNFTELVSIIIAEISIDGV